MTRKPGYLLAIGTPTEQTGVDRYIEKLPPIYEAFDGYRLAMGGQSGRVAFVSGGLKNLSVILSRFPSPDRVSEFWWSDEYREAYAVRRKSGRFSAVGLPGLDRLADPVAGSRGYLVFMATPRSPGRWRRFADALINGLTERGATIMVDAGPEAIERLESLLPGSHVLIAMLPNEQAARDAWHELSPGLQALQQEAEPVNVAVLDGLAEDHPWRVTPRSASAA